MRAGEHNLKQFFRIFYWGMLISFLGSLPPGLMNLVAVQVTQKQGVTAAIFYAMGSMLAEIIIVRIALCGLNWLTKSQRFFRLLEWMTAGLLIIFSIACFITAGASGDSGIVLPEMSWPPFIMGVMISVLNPLHIPFWLGWSTVLIDRQVLVPSARSYNVYITGIGMGTLAGFILFIVAGQYLLKLLDVQQLLINLVLGVVLFIIGLFQIRKIVRVPASVRYAKIFRQS